MSIERGNELQFSRERDAIVCARALSDEYPAYMHVACKPRKARNWRIAVHCATTKAFLQYAKR